MTNTLPQKPVTGSTQSPITQPKQAPGTPGWVFKEQAVASKIGVVVMYDLEDFTTFLGVPDIQHAATRYLNFVDDEVRKIYDGRVPIDSEPDAKPEDPIAVPIHRKFLGDGAMHIFDVTTMTQEWRDYVLKSLILNCWNMKNSFQALDNAARKFMPTARLPPNIRLGITYGTIFELPRADGLQEYIGFPINLAARLQKYAGTASFLASARVDLPYDWYVANGFVKVLPLKLRNADAEYLWIDKGDLAASPEGLFQAVPYKIPPT